MRAHSGSILCAYIASDAALLRIQMQQVRAVEEESSAKLASERLETRRLQNEIASVCSVMRFRSVLIQQIDQRRPHGRKRRARIGTQEARRC